MSGNLAASALDSNVSSAIKRPSANRNWAAWRMPMNRFLRGVVQAMVESFHLPEPILEIGSYQVEGQSNLINLRDLFPSREYVGMAFRPGPGVDLVADVEQLPQPDPSSATVLALTPFTHVPNFCLPF